MMTERQHGAGTEILDESDASGNITNEYVFFGGKRIAMDLVSGGSITATYYYAEDFLGTSRTMVQAGTTSACFDADFYPYGGERDLVSTCNPVYKFEGKERDAETQNDDFGARYYSWRFGRWESPDWSSTPAPVPYANLTNPQTLNLYAMVRDNPETFADLDGHCQQAAVGDTCSVRATDKGLDNEDQEKNKAAQNQNAADKPAPQPAPTDPNGNRTPPPVKVPGAPDLPWKWNPNDQNPRGGDWGPDGWKGPNPPHGSWDPDGHWDIDKGDKSPRDHYDPKGNPITPGQAHPGNIQLPSAKQIVIGIGAVGTGYLIYRGVRMLPSVVFPPLWPTIPLNAAIP